MRAYIVRRLLTGILILFVLSVVVFLMLRITPGDPSNRICPIGSPPACRDAVRKEVGLDDPYPVQYLRWVEGVLTGDLGKAYFSGRPVTEAIKQRFPVTLELLIIDVLVTVAIGVPFGIISALYRNSPADYFVRVTAVLGLSVPAFWVATMVIMVPSELWGYAPPLGRAISFFDDPGGNLRQFVPPAIVGALASSAGIMRLTRSSLLEVLRTDYIRTARSKGLREPVVISRHALKNSIIPVVTVLGLSVSALLGGSVIIEYLFNIPGVGNRILIAITERDVPVVQAFVLIIATFVVFVNLAVDLLYGWVDPRIRLS